MINLMTKILSLCYVVSKTSKHDIFFRYSPHCNSLDVDIHVGGWERDKGPDQQFTLFMNYGTLEDNIKRLHEIKKAIEDLK